MVEDSSEGSITEWIAELELGRTGVAEEQLWQRYFHRLIGIARVKLGETPRAAEDEEDVAVAALQSFFAGIAAKRFPCLHGRDELWPLLAKIAANKALDQQRRLLAEKRGGGRVVSGSAPSSTEWAKSVRDDDLGPESLALVNDECARLLALLSDDQLRNIAKRRLEGYTNAEIARELGVIERTVERRLQLIRALWREHLY